MLDRWLASLKPRPIGRHSPTTLKGYGDIVRLHLKPILGYVRVAELSADHVELLQDRLLSRGLSSQTVLNVRNTLSGALRFAMRRRLLQYNPSRATSPTPSKRSCARLASAIFAATICGTPPRASCRRAGCRRWPPWRSSATPAPMSRWDLWPPAQRLAAPRRRADGQLSCGSRGDQLVIGYMLATFARLSERSDGSKGVILNSIRKEATGGFEPPIAVLQTAALPLGYVARRGTRNCTCWGGLRWPAQICHSSPPCLIALLATA